MQMDILAYKLADSSKKLNQAATGTAHNSSISAAREQLKIIDQEKDIHLQLPPHFLVDRISKSVGRAGGQIHSQSLKNHQTVVKKIATAEQAAIARYAKASPAIKSPLSKPEFEALNNLVDLQAKTKLGKRWQDYHVSLLHSEMHSIFDKNNECVFRIDSPSPRS